MSREIIAVLGGTGKEGSGISMRLARAGYRVIVGSREKEKAERKAREFSAKCGVKISGTTNAEAVSQARIVILTVPSLSHKDMLAQLKDALLVGADFSPRERTTQPYGCVPEVAATRYKKIFVDTTIFLDHENFPKLKLPEEGSAAFQTQAILGENFPIVCAFQNISSVSLNHLDAEIHADVLVCGNNADAKKKIMDMVSAMKMHPLDCGDLSACATLEALTSMLLTMCRIYKVKDAGIKITGIP